MKKITKQIVLLVFIIIPFYVFLTNTNQNKTFIELNSVEYQKSRINKSAFEKNYNLKNSDTLYRVINLNSETINEPKREDLYGILGNFVKVIDNTGIHPEKIYSTNSYYQVDGKYETEIGEKYFDESENIWKVNITVNGKVYAGLYGFEPSYGTGYTHTLIESEDKTKNITLYWDSASGKWSSGKPKGTILAEFLVEEQNMNTTYVINREYYINGKKVGAVDGYEQIGRIGDVLNVSELIEDDWSYYEVNDVTYKFYCTGYGSSKFILKQNPNENVITVTYSIEINSDNDELTLYNVIHKYYTNNIMDGEVKKKYSAKVGTTIYSKDIQKIKTYNDNDYSYIEDDTSIELTSDESKNVIIVKYERTLYSEGYTVIYKDGCEEEVFNNQGEIELNEGTNTPVFKGILTREGYTFIGWELNGTLLEPVGSIHETVQSDDANENREIIYTARWKPIGENEPEQKEDLNNPLTKDKIISMATILTISIIILIALSIYKKGLKY